MQITRGRKKSAQKVIIYAPEGWGKSTCASKMNDALFMDVEDSTKMLDVARIEDDYSNWQTILDNVDYVISQSPGSCETFVIDTLDWAEQACINSLNKKHHTDNILTMDYGKGSQFVHAEFVKLINKLNVLIEKGVNVVILAHASMRKQELPEEMGSFDRWEMKLQSKQVKAQVKEWADAVLFGNYKTLVVEDSKTKSKKARGGKRVIYTCHTPTWDAKNRHGMPDVMDLDYDVLFGYLFQNVTARPEKKEPVKETKRGVKEPKKDENRISDSENEKNPSKNEDKEPKEKTYTPDQIEKRAEWTKGLKIMPELKDLMLKYNVTAWDVEAAVGALKGSPYSQSDSIESYDDTFQEKLIKSFPGMYKKIKKAWDTEEVPFED